MFWEALIFQPNFVKSFLGGFYVQLSCMNSCMTAHNELRARGVLNQWDPSRWWLFWTMRQDSEWRTSHTSHKGPPASSFPLIFPWRSIKRQPFERVHWFLGISGGKTHIPCRSSFNYPIWRPLIWSSRAGSVNRSVGHRSMRIKKWGNANAAFT